jgi:formylglycine-generating enzyme required for sulfatase activity
MKRESAAARRALSYALCAALLAACGEQESPPAPAASHTDMALIPAGEFIMGSDDVDTSGKSEEFGFNEPWYLPEHPQHKVHLKAFYIDLYEVNNGKYKAYLMGTGRVVKNELTKLLQPMQLLVNEHPVRHVTWYDADHYCRSVGKRLPTEAEWEKAARGTEGLEYPWGNDWHADYLNNGGRESQVTPVGSFSQGRSPYGVFDLAGNVMEWVADWYEAYPGSDYQSPKYGQQNKVVRGGGWGGVGHYVIPHYFRGAYRYNFPPDGGYNDVGFRCAMDAT